MIGFATRAVERLPLPDFLTRAGVKFLVGRTAARLATDGAVSEADFAAASNAYPIATHVDDANAQHYELPPEFFGLVLGPRRKYSSCLFAGAGDTLEEAEIRALTETCAHADVKDGQHILELGCGWGSLSLWMAEHFPAARIVAVSNSAPQRAYIEQEARFRGLVNLRVITADMNDFTPAQKFDRIVSVEMFEHMSNWPALLERVAGWIAPEGRLFLHVFTHRTTPYRFDVDDDADWVAKYFFAGGIMPSHGLLAHAARTLEVEAEWRWDGTHYRRTADAWLHNFDRNEDQIRAVLKDVYGKEATLWLRRWRLFFLATSGLFGYDNGEEWGVSHYRLRSLLF